MAINVNTVYKTVLLILNKEQRGYMTPEEFNKIGAQVQLEIFEKYFEDLNQLTRSPQTDTDYADRIAYLEEKLSPLTRYEAGISSQEGVVTNTVHRLNTVVYNDLELQRVSRGEYTNINKSPLTRPSLTQPVFIQENNLIYTYPISVSSNVFLSYIEKPNDPVWSFTSGNTLGVYVYSSTASTNFELHSSEQTELILRILAYAGIVLNNPQIVQAASAAVQNQNINEKR
jgi:hypothetical protein